MPDALPPPPPPSFPPPPPVHPGTTFTQFSPLRPPLAGARKAIVVLMWVAVAGLAALAWAAFARKGTIEDYFVNRSSADDVDDADQLVVSLSTLNVALTVAIAILLAVWSYRAVSNGNARGRDGRPGLAAGGWFIPIGFYWVSFGQLRKAMGRVGTAAIGWWQLLWIVSTVLAGVGRTRVDTDERFQTQDDFVSDLQTQAVLFTVAAVLLAGATVFAGRAVKLVDAVTTTGPSWPDSQYPGIPEHPG